MAQSPPVLDAGGEPLRSGVEYLADPAVADVAGSLTLVARNGSCPFYVGQESARSGRLGIPVIFMLVSGDKQCPTIYKWEYLISHLAHGGGHKRWA